MIGGLILLLSCKTYSTVVDDDGKFFLDPSSVNNFSRVHYTTLTPLYTVHTRYGGSSPVSLGYSSLTSPWRRPCARGNENVERGEKNKNQSYSQTHQTSIALANDNVSSYACPSRPVSSRLVCLVYVVRSSLRRETLPAPPRQNHLPHIDNISLLPFNRAYTYI